MTRGCAFILVAFFAVPPLATAQEGIPGKTLDFLKAATVFIQVEGQLGTGSGSGFLVHVDGQTGLVATNRHVVGRKGTQAAPKCTVVFWSGTKKEQVVPAEVVAVDPDEDLALVRVKARELPAPIDLSPADLRETMTVYSFGFPLGNVLATDRANPSVTIGKGTISSLPEDSHGRLDRVQLDGELNPGNSGGPVVDDRGRLVGVVVARIVGTKISFAIPATSLSAMLRGRASSPVVRSVNVEKGTAEVELEVPVVDPLGRLDRVEVRHVKRDAVSTPPACDRDGVWAPLSTGETAAVKTDSGKGAVKVKVRGPKNGTGEFCFQTVFTREDGKALGAEPVDHTVDFSRPGVVRGDRRRWETIVSKAGGFTVDMPAKLVINESGTKRVGASVLETLTLGCETENGVYLAQRMNLPTALPPEIGGILLDAARDVSAAQWNGEVVTEKRIRTPGGQGRDFTITGKPDGREVACIRVRQYLVGRNLFAVAVVAPGTELPDDAGRFLGSLALGEARTRASGTPEAEHTGTEVPGWGLAIDPDNDCKITPKGKSLAFRIPGKLHDLYFDGGPTNAPRVMREVEGDFVATVRVKGEFKPGPDSTNPRSIPFHGAGFLLWSDSDNNVRIERIAMLRGKQYATGVLFEEREGGYSGATHTELFKPGDCHLRIERTGSKIVASMSYDGKAWKSLKPVDALWPAKIKVGLTAITTSSQPFEVSFDSFELEQKP
jgi:regulation of enolase protein 1 (concanavalin A-like superfamily)